MIHRSTKIAATCLLFLVVSMVGASAKSAPDLSPVKQFLDESVAKGTVAGGSVIILHKGVTIFEYGFGYADVKSKKPFLVNTPAVIASISKPLLGTAAYRLSEQKKLDLEAPISKYLPEFANPKLESGAPLLRAPTLSELFTHTSGMRHDSATGGRPWFADWTKGKSLAVVVSKIAKDFPFKSQPGTRYAYSGIGTEVAARVLEVTSGSLRNDLLVTEVTTPLGMKHTFFRDAEGLKKLPPMPTRYYTNKDGKLTEAKKQLVPPTNTYSSSGGTIISTAPDLSRWLLMIRNNGRHDGKVFLSPETVATMLSPQPKSNNARGGLFIRKKDAAKKATGFGHTGSSGTNVWIDFEHDIIGIMLTQTRGKDIKPFRLKLEKVVTDCVTQPRG